MSLNATEEDDENLRKQCENASLKDDTESTKSVVSKSQLPPIKLGMSFSDWKQMKDAERDSQNNKSGNNTKKPHTAKKGQNQRFNRLPFDSTLQRRHNESFRSQQQNFPNFNLFPPFQNLQPPKDGRGFCEDTVLQSKIPPLMPPPSFDDFCHDDSLWSSGPLMQPLFPPMPQIPRISQQQGSRTNTSVQYNKRNFGQKRSSAKSKPQSGSNMSPKLSKATNSTEVDATQNEQIKTKAQIYILPPRPRKEVKPHWVVIPPAPPAMDADTPESREEKARMWREYRKAMKPFKNREFANAKRVVQRLGKKNYEELDEKDRDRLDRALERVNGHKAMLNSHKAKLDEKYGRNKNNQVENFVPQPPTLTESFVSGGVYMPANSSQNSINI